VVLLCLFCCDIYFSVHQYRLVSIYLSVFFISYFYLVDIESLATLSCFVIRSFIGNIAFRFMFHCMNLVDCIFWICLLVPFLVVCVVLFFPVWL